MLRDRGDNPDELPRTCAEMINTAIAGHPADMRITMHLCRGNFRSSWIAQGGYEPVLDLLFNGIGVAGYFMEFRTDARQDTIPALCAEGQDGCTRNRDPGSWRS